MLHDFAVTANYTLFLDFPCASSSQELIHSQGQVKPFAVRPRESTPGPYNPPPSILHWVSQWWGSSFGCFWRVPESWIYPCVQG